MSEKPHKSLKPYDCNGFPEHCLCVSCSKLWKKSIVDQCVRIDSVLRNVLKDCHKSPKGMLLVHDAIESNKSVKAIYATNS